MKTWLTYLVAGLLGILSRSVFGDVSKACSVIVSLLSIASVPLVSIPLAAGVASSIKKGRTRSPKSFLLFILFSFVAGLLCSLSGAVATSLISYPFSVSLVRSASSFSLKIPALVWAILLAIIVGFSFRPTSKIYIPAYNALNSLSEVCYRLMKGLSRFFFIFIFFFATSFTVNFESVLSLICFALFLTLVLIPLTFAVFTGFKVNPYLVFMRFLPSMLCAFFSSSFSVSLSPLYTNARSNMGIQKKTVSQTVPLSLFLCRGGSAAFTSFIVVSVLSSSSLSMKILIVLISVLVSLLCPFNAGFEVLFTVTVSLRILGYEDTQALISLSSILPILSSLCMMTDVEISGFASAYTAHKKGVMCRICANDLV